MNKDRFWSMMLFLLIALCATLTFALLRPEPAGGHGAPHPRIPTLQQGGDGGRHAGVIWIGALYGSLQIAFYVACLTLGLRARRGRTAICAVGVVYALLLLAVMYFYSREIAGQELFVFGFPVSTALMLAGIWPLPLTFVALYSVYFDRWFLSSDDVEQLRRRFPKQLESLDGE